MRNIFVLVFIHFIFYTYYIFCQNTNNGDVLTIVGTVDGKIHGINQNLEKVWSVSTGGPMVATQNNHESLGDDEYHSKENIDPHDTAKDYSVLTSIDGSIMYQTRDGMRKTSVTARFLTEQAPFVSKEGLIFTGKKSSKIFGFDLNSGKILYDYATGDKFRATVGGANALKKLPMMNINSVSTISPVWMGRVDYSLRAVDSITGKEQFNLTYSELHPLLSQSISDAAASATNNEYEDLSDNSEGGTLAIINTATNSVISSYYSSSRIEGDMELISTPTGDLYFVDENGKFIEKVPLGLEYPVINAFKFKKKSNSNDVNLDSNKRFDIGKININYRMVAPSSDLYTNIKTNNLPLISTLQDNLFEQDDEYKEEKLIMFVQSSSSLHLIDDENAALYVMPVTTMHTLEEDSMSTDKLLTTTTVSNNDNLLPALLSDRTISTDVVRNSEPISSSASSRNKVISPSLHSTNTISITPKQTPGTFKSLKNIQYLKDLNSLSQNNIPISKLIQQSKSTEIVSETKVQSSHTRINALSTCINPYSKYYYLLDSNEICYVCYVNSRIESCGNDVNIRSVRGPHKLREELYDGNLFSPHQISALFTGVLSHDKINSNSQRTHSNLLDDDYVSFDISKKTSALPTMNYRTSEILFQRMAQIIELLVLYTITAILLLVITLLGIVYFIRCSTQYSHLLPANTSFIQQMIYIINNFITSILVTSSIKKTSSSSSLSISNLKISKSSESLDAKGRKLLHIGALIVNVEEILGYGSHGTVVYKGSLNGRPLAVKRILSQFTKEADREISLLIKSDGHPNVVRYFLKEERRDFVYLGLQLCEMSLKDLIVKIKQYRELNNFITNGNEMVSDEVRTSLLQIAQGLAHLHSQKIVHRDIKPHNILCANPNESNIEGLKDKSISVDEIGADELNKATMSSLTQLSSYILKISDMGLSKQLDRDENSFSSMSFSMPITSLSFNNQNHLNSSTDKPPHNHNKEITDEQRALVMMQNQAAVGTVGWQAPELISHRYQYKIQSTNEILSNEIKENLNESDDDADEEDIIIRDGTQDDIGTLSFQRKQQRDRKKRTLTVDIFSLGCVFYYVLTIGGHPFGEWFEREMNIVSGNIKLSGLEQDPIAQDLITWMLDIDPLKRPTSKEVCEHIFFWSYSKRLEFLVEFSDRLEQESADSAIMLSVEANNNNSISSIIGSRWDRRLDPLLLEDMGKYRKYDTSSVRDLLRVIRNKRHHFHELSAELKSSIGNLPNGFYSYFNERFPNLILHCVEISNRYLSMERTFKSFTGSISNRWRRRKPDMVVVDQIVHSYGVNNSSSDKEKQSISLIESKNRSLEDDVHNNDKSKVITSDDQISESVKDNTNLHDVIVLHGSILESSLKCNGWWRNYTDWVEGVGINSSTTTTNTSAAGNKKVRASHLIKSSTDLKYRTRLCSHWEMTSGGSCPMRKKGKCIFAHGPLELRVKETRRDKWGIISISSRNSTLNDNNNHSTNNLLRISGGEDVLGAARIADKSSGNTMNSSVTNNNSNITATMNNNSNNNRSNPFQSNSSFMMYPPNMYYSTGHTIYYQNNYQPPTPSQPSASNNNNTTTDNDNNN